MKKAEAMCYKMPRSKATPDNTFFSNQTETKHCRAWEKKKGGMYGIRNRH
ncbi:hypothetical protein AGMMS4952_19270 [Spirochaetia bacterium]|nr:hypothetical protein AGMMS4952_19270 [Spirochaetia bacterium]